MRLTLFLLIILLNFHLYTHCFPLKRKSLKDHSRVPSKKKKKWASPWNANLKFSEINAREVNVCLWFLTWLLMAVLRLDKCLDSKASAVNY